MTKHAHGPASLFWPAGFPADIAVPDTNLAAALKRSAEAAPESPAVHYYGTTISYAALLRSVEALAGHLEHLGVRRGDRVVLDMQNCPQFLIAFYAILRVGGVVVPINPMNTAHEIAFIVADSGADVAICGNELAPRFAPLLGGKGLSHLLSAFYADALLVPTDDPLPPVMTEPKRELPSGATDFAVAIERDLRAGPPSGRGADIAVMTYTSGTTGRPKACVHDHAAVGFTAEAQALWYGLDRTATMTCFMPLFHVAGMQASMNAGLRCGAALVMMTRWNRDLIPPLFSRHRVTWWSAAPTMIVDVLAGPGFDYACFENLRVLTGGGSAMPEAVAERLRSRFGLVFCEAYGLTETISATHINPLQAPKPQCLGLPIFNTVSIVADPDTLSPLPEGQHGEILVAGPQIMLRYHGRPEDTEAAFAVVDGRRYLRTGDIGYVDADGYFFMVDRSKRIVNVSGHKVSPAECEAALYHHPAVQECCVVSSPDPRTGEKVKAFVVLGSGSPRETAAASIRSYLAERLAAYKLPREIVFVDALPRSGSGKVDWHHLQKREWEPAT